MINNMKIEFYSAPIVEEFDLLPCDAVLAESKDSVEIDDFEDMGELL